MRRLILLLILLSVLCLPVFSDYEEKERFNFTAYYQKTHDEKYVTLDVYDSRLNSGIIMIANQGKPANEEVFYWEITGNIATRVNLTFWFTPLQAYKDGIYYIPDHTFQLYKPDATIITPSTIDNTTLYDSFLVKPKNYISFNKVSGSYQYPDGHYKSGGTSNKPTNFYYYIQLYGTIQKGNNGPVLNEANGEEATWTRRGYCALTVNDYADNVQGDFSYISNVKIEVSVP